MKRNQPIKKALFELGVLALAVFGVIILIAYLFRWMPYTGWYVIDVGLWTMIGYGILVGPIFIAVGVGAFFEIRSTDYRRDSKKVHR